MTKDEILTVIFFIALGYLIWDILRVRGEIRRLDDTED